MSFDEEELDPHGECAAEINRLRTALQAVKDLVCGERFPRWAEDGWTVTATRGQIADLCDVALDPTIKQPIVRVGA